MKKTLLFILVALLPMVVNAYDAEIDGIYYNFSGNKAIVTYRNTDYNSYYGDVVIPSSVIYNSRTYSVTSIGSYAFNHCSDLTSVTIPNSVTNIDGFAFSGCSGLTTVTVPNSVTSIGNYAFYQCSGLTSVTIPNKVTSISNYAFSHCCGLTSIDIPGSVTSIGERAFAYCSGLTSVIIPESVTSIGGYAFSNCDDLTDVWCYAKRVPTTESNAFSGSSINSATLHVSAASVEAYRTSSPWRGFGTIVAIPNYILTYLVDDEVYKTYEIEYHTSITPEPAPIKEGHTFSGWSEIPETMPNHDVTVTGSFIPNNYILIYIVDDEVYKTYLVEYNTAITPEPMPAKRGMAFSGWGNVPSTMPAHDVILSGTYNGLEATKDSIIYQVADTLNNYASVVGNKNISGEAEILSIVEIDGFAYNVNNINDSAFDGCTNLTSVTIPNNVTSIGASAFKGCTSLTNFIIPESVTFIGNQAFDECQLFNVLIKCVTPPVTDGKTFFSEQSFYHTTLYIPIGSWKAYAFDNSWYQFINIRETATAEEQVSEQQAYTLMDASTFTYSVYDPVNDCIGTISSVGINEDNPNHSWQVIEVGGEHYLYNVGAKKFVVAANGSYSLSDEPISINMKNGDNGIILGTQAEKQWALVSNESMSVNQAIITGVFPLGETEEGVVIYNLSGQRLNEKQKGINIVGGKKVLVK